MRGVTFAVIFGIIVLGFGFSETVDAFSITHNQITSGPSNDLSPTLGNNGTHNILVYTQLDLTGLGVITYQILNSDGSPNGTPVEIGDSTTNDRLNDISGNRIVYTAFSAGGTLGQVMLYDISTGITTAVSTIAPIQEARISGDTIAWVEGALGATQIKTISVPLIESGASPITLGAPGSRAVEVGDKFVTWSEPGAGGTLDIAAYEIASGFTLPISANPITNESEPSTSGDWIVWYFTSALGGTGIAAINLATFDARIVVEDGFNARLPTVDGDLLSYESNLSGNFDIYLYRFSDSQTFQITTSSNDQQLNNVFGDLISYSDLSGPANGDIYVSSFDLTLDVDGDGVPYGLDCNDNDSTIFPGAPELLDGKDNNCDGIIDEVFGSPPIANDDVAFIDQTTLIPITIDYLANDSDPDGDPIFVDAIDTTGTRGTVEDNEINFIFTPEFGFVGTTSFEYTIFDDPWGNSDTATVTITVYGDSFPLAYFTATPNPAEPSQSISFDASLSSHSDPRHRILSYAWDFGDGTTEHNLDPVTTHTYPDAGNYVVILTVEDDSSPPKDSVSSVSIDVTSNSYVYGTITDALTGFPPDLKSVQIIAYDAASVDTVNGDLSVSSIVGTSTMSSITGDYSVPVPGDVEVMIFYYAGDRSQFLSEMNDNIHVYENFVDPLLPTRFVVPTGSSSGPHDVQLEQSIVTISGTITDGFTGGVPGPGEIITVRAYSEDYVVGNSGSVDPFFALTSSPMNTDGTYSLDIPVPNNVMILFESLSSLPSEMYDDIPASSTGTSDYNLVTVFDIQPGTTDISNVDAVLGENSSSDSDGDGVPDAVDSNPNAFTPSTGDWNDPNTWEGGIVPSSSDDVEIPIGVEVIWNSSSEFSGTIINYGTLTIAEGPDLHLDITSAGTVINHGTITTQNLSVIQNWGTLTNIGTINNTVGGNIFSYDGTFVTSGTIDNMNTIAIYGGTFDNSGTITIVSGGGGLTNHVNDFTNSGDINISSALFNHGTITNSGTINNNGSVFNFDTGIIDNSGNITNNSINFHNLGTLNNECGGEYIGTAPNSNPVVELCASTTVQIYGTLTDVNGNPIPDGSVYAYDSDDLDTGSISSSVHVGYATTDSNGFYSVSVPVSAGAVNLLFLSDTFLSEVYDDIVAINGVDSLDSTTFFDIPLSLDTDIGIDATLSSALDSDGDGVPDDVDNCPTTQNPTQEDVDGDGIGLECDDLIDIISDTFFDSSIIIPSTSLLNIATGITLSVSHTISNFGILDNSGTISFTPYSNSKFINHGYITNDGIIHINSLDYVAVGILENSGTIINNNEININSDDSLSSELINFGFIENHGTVNNFAKTVSSDTFDNYGTVNNFAKIVSSDTFDNYGTVNNFATFENFGVFTNNQFVQNHGTILNHNTFVNYDVVINSANFFILEFGSFTNELGSFFSNADILEFVTTNSFTNRGTFENKDLIRGSEPLPEMYYLINDGIFDNKQTGTFSPGIGILNDCNGSVESDELLLGNIQFICPHFSDESISASIGGNTITGTTYGTIIETGDQLISIFELLNPSGIGLITGPGGTIPAKISFCGGAAELFFASEIEIIASCGSVTLEIIQGEIQTTLTSGDGTTAQATLDSGDNFFFDDETFELTSNTGTAQITLTGDDGTVAQVTIPENNSITFEPETSTIITPPENTEPIPVIIDGTETEIKPGESEITLSPRTITQNVQTELSAITSDDKKDQKRIDKADKAIGKSLEDKLWSDDSTLTKHGEKVFDESKKAVKELLKVKSVDVSRIINNLVAADQSLAEIAIDSIPVDTGDKKVDQELDNANKEMDKALQELEKGKPDKAIDKFKKAWEHSQKAVKHEMDDESDHEDKESKDKEDKKDDKQKDKKHKDD